MSETSIMQQIQLALGRLKNVRLFRNNTGTGWAGQVVKFPGKDDVVVKNARPLQAGLTTGSADLIGWKTITITPDMVGKPVAVFLSVEVKTARGRPTEDQLNWKDQIDKAGGIAFICRSPEEALQMID